jgi:23S rRNA (guanosine2251-2'-O)-methyltransferase
MSQKILVGFHAVISKLRTSPASLKTVYYDFSRRDRRMKDFVELAHHSLGKKLHQADTERLRQLAGHDRHQGIVAFAEETSLTRTIPELLDQLGNKKSLLLVLDGVTDPHNLGACLRVADGAGIDAIIVPKDRSVQINATVSKVASGAAETIPLVAVTNLARTLRELQEGGIWVVGLAEEAEKSIYEHDFTGSTALVMGAEGDGMRRLTKENCDELLSIPMSGGVESLNVSVASGVCL